MRSGPHRRPMSTDAYEVYAIRYGTRRTARSLVYLNFHLYDEADVAIDMDYYLWIVRNHAATVIVDCGFDPTVGARRGRTTVYPVVSALAGFGIEPTDADTILITHAHYDHIGNLASFPRARVLISPREYEFWTGSMGTRRQFSESTEAAEIAHLRALAEAGRLRFADEWEAAPGIRAVEVGGHTPGQLVVVVPTSRGDVVLTSDAMHYYEELDRDWPFLHAASLEQMYAGLDTLRGMAAAGATLVAGHDPAVMRRFGAGLDVPAGLAGVAVRIA